MMVALCAVLVSPPALRALAATFGCGLVLAVSYSILILGWHFPSDVLGGFLVAGTWTWLTLTVLLRIERHRGLSSELDDEKVPARSAIAPGAAVAVGMFALIVRETVAPIHAPLGGSVIGAAALVGALAAATIGLLLVALNPPRRAHLEAAMAHRQSPPTLS
jgi:hypothetical protein